MAKCYGGSEGRGVPFSWEKEAMLGLWGPWTLSSIPSCRCPWGPGVPHALGPLNLKVGPASLGLEGKPTLPASALQ